MANNDWEIKSRGEKCSATGRQFEHEELFYTLLYREKGGFRREDLSESAWAERNDNIQPFSFWKTRYQAPTPAAPEAMPQQNVEGLLRDLMAEDNPEHTNARYILAVMLERKKTLKQIEARETEAGALLIYEHNKTGEIFLVPDPKLRLEEVERVQFEVAGLLGIPIPGAPAPSTGAAAAPAAASPDQPELALQPEQ